LAVVAQVTAIRERHKQVVQVAVAVVPMGQVVHLLQESAVLVLLVKVTLVEVETHLQMMLAILLLAVAVVLAQLVVTLLQLVAYRALEVLELRLIQVGARQLVLVKM
jgi:hypothetical protein